MCGWVHFVLENVRAVFQIPAMVPPLPAGAAPPLPTSSPPPAFPTPTSSQPPLPTSPPPRPAISSSISTRSHLLKAIQEGKTLKKTITKDGSGLHRSPEIHVRGECVSMGKSDVVNGKENGGVKNSERPSGNDLMKAILEAKPLRKASTGASVGQEEAGLEAGLGAGLGAGQGAEPGAGLDAGLGAGQDAGLGAGPGNNLFEALRGEGKQSEGKERENTDWGSKTGDSVVCEAKPVTKTTKEASGDSPSGQGGLRSHNKVVEALKERKGRKSLGEIGKGEEAKKENGLRAAQTNDGGEKTIQNKEKVEKSQGLCVVQGLLYPPSPFQDMDGNPAKVRHS